MAGETTKCEALCLRIVPWSRTSHIVTWLTPTGKLTTVVKGAVRPKSAFLGQYDVNYRCEIVYYLRAKGELHALRECTPVADRAALRSRFRALVLAEHERQLVYDLAPNGPDAADWFARLDSALDRLMAPNAHLAAEMLAFELEILRLTGLSPELETGQGSFRLRGERQIPVSSEVARCLRAPHMVKYTSTLLEALRVIGVFYAFHVETSPVARRIVLQIISTNEAKRGNPENG